MILKIIHEVLFKALRILNFELQRQRETQMLICCLLIHFPVGCTRQCSTRLKPEGSFASPHPSGRQGPRQLDHLPLLLPGWEQGAELEREWQGDQLVPIGIGGSCIHCATMLAPSFFIWRNNSWSTFTEIWIFLIKCLHLNSWVHKFETFSFQELFCVEKKF